MSVRRVLVLEHERDAPAGLLDGWFEHHGAEVELLDAKSTARHPAPADYELIVALGSECSAGDARLDWVARELELLRGALAAGTPVLGICFGCQLLARALGGEVFAAREPEIGWMNVHSTDASLIAEGPWFQWHFETFALPAGVHALAASAAGPQAFASGRSLGVQFHPEVDEAIVRGWTESAPAELERSRVDPASLLADTRAHASFASEAAWALFEAYRARIARVWG